MSRFKSIITLKQLTPMIHFQYADYGACLRASDVKPRLDKYILKNKPNLKVDHNNWFIDPGTNNALDYRMTITIGDSPEVSITNYRENAIEKERNVDDTLKRQYLSKVNGLYSGKVGNPKSFFGNMVEGKGEEKCKNIIKQYREGILVKSDIIIYIFTLKTDLLEEIKRYIADFFLINNFGTRSDKGLGSFYVSEIDGERAKDEERNPEHLSSLLGKPVYYINLKKQNNKYALDDIRIIYALMKGGINYSKLSDDYYKGFIYRYFFSDGKYYKNNQKPDKVPRNDKAFMKRRFDWREKGGINLDRNDGSEDRDWNDGYNDNEYLYVRAMLGVPDFMEFKDHIRSGKVKIKADNGAIKRVPSPIVFKVLPGYIYILPQDIDKNILGAKFHFSKDTQTNSKDTKMIKTPEQFDLIHFLDSFMDDFNNKEKHDGLEKGLSEANHRDFERVKEQLISRCDSQKNMSGEESQ